MTRNDKYYEDHGERRRAQVRDYYWRERERVLRRQRAYYYANRAAIKLRRYRSAEARQLEQVHV